MADNENKSDKKLEEANFEVSSLAEVKDETGNGIFHMRTKTKFILAISILILLAAGALIYLTLEKIFAAETWQLAVWGLCGVLALYSIFSRSIAALLLNIILFFGVSFISTWQSGYETFRPVIEKFTSEPAEEPAQDIQVAPAVNATQSPTPEEKSPEVETPKAAETKPAEIETSPARNETAEPVTPSIKETPERENSPSTLDLPSI